MGVPYYSSYGQRHDVRPVLSRTSLRVAKEEEVMKTIPEFRQKHIASSPCREAQRFWILKIRLGPKLH